MQIHQGGRVAHRGEEALQQIRPAHLQGGGGKAGVAADVLSRQQLPVDHQAHPALRVVDELKHTGRAGGRTQQLAHLLRRGEGEAGTVQLGGDVLGFKGLVPRHHQQVEIGLLPIGQQRR